MKRILPLLFLIFALSAQAQMRQTAWSLAIGHTSILDTYLSPEHYSGMELRLMNSYETEKAASVWRSQLSHSLLYANASPKGSSASDLVALYTLQFARLRELNSPVEKLRCWAGCEARFDGGAVYNTRNGNNPAQMRLALAFAPKVKGECSFRLAGKELLAAYNASLPILGVAFSPQYGQSYYEIFSLGDYDHNACLTTPFNALSFSQHLTLDIPFRRGALRIGYLGDYRQTHLNEIRTHHFTHSLTLGWRL